MKKGDIMKKIISVLTAAIMLCLSSFVVVYAEEETHVESKWAIMWSEHIYYIRFDQNVSEAGDMFHVTYTMKNQDAVFELENDNIEIYADERLELVLRFPDFISNSFSLFSFFRIRSTSSPLLFLKKISSVLPRCSAWP